MAVRGMVARKAAAAATSPLERDRRWRVAGGRGGKAEGAVNAVDTANARLEEEAEVADDDGQCQPGEERRRELLQTRRRDVAGVARKGGQTGGEGGDSRSRDGEGVEHDGMHVDSELGGKGSVRGELLAFHGAEA